MELKISSALGLSRATLQETSTGVIRTVLPKKDMPSEFMHSRVDILMDRVVCYGLPHVTV